MAGHEEPPKEKSDAKIIDITDRIKQRGHEAYLASLNEGWEYSQEQIREDLSLEAVETLDKVADAAEALIGSILDLQRYRRTEYSGVIAAVDTAIAVGKHSIDSMVTRNGIKVISDPESDG